MHSPAGTLAPDVTLGPDRLFRLGDPRDREGSPWIRLSVDSGPDFPVLGEMTGWVSDPGALTGGSECPARPRERATLECAPNNSNPQLNW